MEIQYNRPDAQGTRRVWFPDSDMVENLSLTALSANRYRLEETPGFSESASYGDTIEANVDAKGILRFARVVVRSGLRTIRSLVPESFVQSRAWELLKERIREVGGQWEQLFGGYVILHVPLDSMVELEAALGQAIRDGETGAT